NSGTLRLSGGPTSLTKENPRARPWFWENASGTTLDLFEASGYQGLIEQRGQLLGVGAGNPRLQIGWDAAKAAQDRPQHQVTVPLLASTLHALLTPSLQPLLASLGAANSFDTGDVRHLSFLLPLHDFSAQRQFSRRGQGEEPVNKAE